MKHLRYIGLLLLLLNGANIFAQTEKEQKKFWKQVRKEMPEFRKIFRKYKKYRFEIIYTRIERDPEKGNVYHRYYFGDHEQYFYPASTVKFPMALKTCQRLNGITGNAIRLSAGFFILPKDSVFCGSINKTYLAHKYMRTTDSTAIMIAVARSGLSREEFCRINQLDPFKKIAPGKILRLTAQPEPVEVNEMMSEMLAYSNNNYFNWLFELAANEETEIEKPGISIRKRLMVCPQSDSTILRALVLRPKNSHLHTMDTVVKSQTFLGRYSKHLFAGYTVGKKHYDFNDQLQLRGRNFYNHNEVSLEALQNQLIELMYPGFLPEGNTYNITTTQRMQLIRYMGMRPSEDKMATDSNYLEAPDDLTNFLYTGQQHVSIPSHIRIVNIIGQAYGFVTDCAYIADEKNKTEFFLAARIYVNKDEILNDDKYEYNQIAYPLMEKLGKIISQHEQEFPQGLAKLPAVFQIDW